MLPKERWRSFLKKAIKERMACRGISTTFCALTRRERVAQCLTKYASNWYLLVWKYITALLSDIFEPVHTQMSSLALASFHFGRVNNVGCTFACWIITPHPLPYLSFHTAINGSARQMSAGLSPAALPLGKDQTMHFWEMQKHVGTSHSPVQCQMVDRFYLQKFLIGR